MEIPRHKFLVSQGTVSGGITTKDYRDGNEDTAYAWLRAFDEKRPNLMDSEFNLIMSVDLWSSNLYVDTIGTRRLEYDAQAGYTLNDNLFEGNLALMVRTYLKTHLELEASSFIDYTLGKDHAYSANLVVVETAQYDGELISAHMNVLDEGKNMDEVQTWTVESFFEFLKDRKHDATTVLQLDLDISNDDTVGAWLNVVDNLENMVELDSSAAKDFMAIAITMETSDRGFASNVDFHLMEMELVNFRLFFNAEDTDGYYTPRGVFELSLDETPVLNLTLSMDFDTEVGSNDLLKASIYLIETVYFKRQLLSATADLITVDQIAAGITTWTADTRFAFNEDMLHDASIILTTDTSTASDNSVGIWMSATDRTGKKNKVLVELSSSVRTFHRGFASVMDLQVVEVPWIYFYQNFEISALGNGAFSPHGSLMLALKDAPVLNSTLIMEIDQKLGTDGMVQVSLELSETVVCNGNVISMSAHIVPDAINGAGSKRWDGEVVLKYKDFSKLDVEVDLTIDWEMESDDTIGVWGQIVDKKTEQEGVKVLASLASSIHYLRQGVSSDFFFEVVEESWVRMNQNASWNFNDGAFVPQGTLYLSLNDDVVVNASLDAKFDTKLGSDDAVSASISLVETVHFDENGEVLTIAATIVHAGMNDAGIDVWVGDVYLDYKQDSKFNISGKLILDADIKSDETIGIWGHMVDNMRDVSEPIASLSSSVVAAGQGLKTQLDLTVKEENLVYLTQNMSWGWSDDSFDFHGDLLLALIDDLYINGTSKAAFKIKSEPDAYMLIVSALLTESANYEGELVNVNANLNAARNAIDEQIKLICDGSVHIMQDAKIDVSAIATIESTSKSNGVAVLVFSTISNNLANEDARHIAEVAASFNMGEGGISSEIDLSVVDNKQIYWLQNASWQSSDGLYTTEGLAEFWFGGDAILNLTINAEMDTTLGPEKDLGASFILVDTQQYGGFTVEFDVTFISEETGGEEMKSWEGNTTFYINRDPIFDASFDISMNTNMPNSMEVWVLVTDNLIETGKSRELASL